VELDADPQAAMGDEDTAIFVFQAVRELLYNVVKHAGVNAARVSLRRREGRIEAIVDDDGGFDLARVQTREEASEKFGLFSIRERVQLLGGSLRVRTSPGQPAAAHRAGEHRIGVMIVDDHPLLRSGLAGLIGCQPDMYTLGEAADGDDAVETARALRPDVILMDINLPRVNGVEATRQIVGQVPGVSVVGLSMHDTQEIIAAMREAGAVDYVAKDAPPELLLAAIRRAAARAVALRGGIVREAE
jgi:CheY-like chemotaxis protein